MRKTNGSTSALGQVRRVVAAGAVALSVVLIVSVGGESESVSDLHVAVVTE